jgi:NADH-quinone oxidoreductase subunit N
MDATILQDLKPLSPVLIVFAGAMALLLTGVFIRRENRYVLPYVALGTLACAFVALLNYWGPSRLIFQGAVRIDTFGLFISALILIAGMMTCLTSVGYARRLDFDHGEYFALILFACGGMMLMAQSYNLMTLFLSLEIMSISVYALAGMSRKRLKTNEAAMKYFVLGAFSTGFLLFGMAFLFGITQTLDIRALLPAEMAQNRPLLIAALGLLIVGFGFKIGAAPFHVWVPDVYEGAPSTVTGFMAVAVKAAGFAALLRVILLIFPGAMTEFWWPVFWAVALLTMFLGNIIAVFQKNVKRMLAYSGIAHSGYLLIGLVSMGILSSYPRLAAGSDLMSTLGAGILFYLLSYTIMTLGAFAVIALSVRENEDLETLDDFAGLARSRPAVALAMTLFLVSMAGIPPLGGFVAKFFIFKGAIDVQGLLLDGGVGQYHALALALLGIVTSMFSVYYYLRVVWYMYFRDPVEERSTVSPSWGLHFVIFASGILIVVLGVLPSGFFRMAARGAESLVR